MRRPEKLPNGRKCFIMASKLIKNYQRGLKMIKKCPDGQKCWRTVRLILERSEISANGQRDVSERPEIFYNSQNRLKTVKNFKNSQKKNSKWPKMLRNGQECQGIVQVILEWSEMFKNGQRSSWMVSLILARIDYKLSESFQMVKKTIIDVVKWLEPFQNG